MSLLSRVLLLWGLCAVPLAQAFNDNGDGTMTDPATNLVWDRCVLGSRTTAATSCADNTNATYNWTNALAQVNTRNTANHLGFSDWRLPNRNELESLVKIDALNPAIDTTAFPSTPTNPTWTSTTDAATRSFAWNVNFNNGGVVPVGKNTNTHFVRLVRSGQTLASFDSLAPVNGACGSGHATTPLVTTAPSVGVLCTAGSASVVTSGVSAFTWSCAGRNGGTTASCSASRGYTVSPSAGANGSISPDTAQVVAYNATPAFTATPTMGYAVNSWVGSCGGAASGAGNVTYTTAGVATDCTVSVSFVGNDSTPDVFAFTAANGVALSTLQTSNTITVAGLTTGAAISITGGEYQINSGSFTTATGTVNNGDTVTVRHTSSGAHSTAATTTLTIGGVSADFVSTTLVPPPVNGACGSAHATTPLLTSAPSTNLCTAGTATSVATGASAFTWSCTGTNSGTTANCSASRGYTVTASAGAGAGNGSISPSTPQVVAHNATPAFTLTPNTGYAASATGCGGSLSGNTYTTAAVTADCAVSASFTGNDSTPDAFSFTAQTGVALSTVQTSNSITVAGINTAANISIAGGEYSINSGAPTSTAGTVNNGDTIAVRHTSSGAHSTAATTTLTIGGVSAQFVSTTMAAPPVNGSCGSAHSPSLVTSAPSTNLCAAGTASSVTPGASAFTWSCTGANSGTTAPCSASRGYTVTASAGANGSISPSMPQVVAHNATPAFTATPAANYAVNAWAGTCGGTASGTGNVSYTTAAVTTDCTVSVSFSGTDATPDAFSFTAANGVALSTLQTSNTITVAGINTGAAISITGGEFQIGSGGFVSTAGTVNNGNTVTVRHTSSGAHSTATTTTLTIGGVSADFVSTTVAATVVNGACGSSANVATAFLPTANLCSAGTASTATPGRSSWAWSCSGTGPSATSATCSAPYPPVNGGGGTVGAIQTPSTNNWQIDQAASGFVPAPAPAPAGVTFPDGATKVVLITGAAGTSSTVTLRFSSIPAGAQLYKYGKENGIGDTNKWFAYPATIDVAVGTVTYTLTDGQKGDNDWTVNSVIDDPVALAAPAVANGVTSVPTLSEWAMMALAALLALTTFVTMRRRMG